jgi:uncharacterized membrane protein
MRIFGHPVHPMLVHFPVAFWTVATGAYLWVASGAGEPVVVIAKLANSAGLIMAILAMFAGLLELRSISRSCRARVYDGKHLEQSIGILSGPRRH